MDIERMVEWIDERREYEGTDERKKDEWMDD